MHRVICAGLVLVESRDAGYVRRAHARLSAMAQWPTSALYGKKVEYHAA